VTWPSGRALHGGIDEVPLPDTQGRLWLCGKHYVGPDPEAALASVDANAVLCLNQRHELRTRYPEYVDWLEANAPGRAQWHPIPDLGAPPIDEARSLVAQLGERVGAGERVIVHCGAGIGRAGTIAAALLMSMGVPLDRATATVAASRPNAGPEAGPQTALLVALTPGAAGA